MLCKLREWVWTETGKGDRLEGDSRVGPSPPSEQPAPPHSLHEPPERDQRPASFTCRPVVLQRPVPALSACLCLDPMPATLVSCICPCIPSITMCARFIAQVAGTALQAAPSTIVFACVHDHPVHFREEPGTALGSRLPPCPCVHCFLCSIQGGAWDCIGQPATFLSLHREPDCIWAAWLPSSNGLWDGIWHAGLR